jgi:gas vesicle protein
MSDSNDRFFYFLLGGFVGAVTALLMAPQSGRETRDLIASRAREGADVVSSRTRQVADLATATSRNIQHQASDLMDRSTEVFNKQREQLNAAVEAGKQAYREEKSRLRQDQE